MNVRILETKQQVNWVRESLLINITSVANHSCMVYRGLHVHIKLSACITGSHFTYLEDSYAAAHISATITVKHPLLPLSAVEFYWEYGYIHGYDIQKRELILWYHVWGRKAIDWMLQSSSGTFSLMKIKAFSQNVSTVSQSQSWYQRTLFFVYAGANWEATTSGHDICMY